LPEYRSGSSAKRNDTTFLQKIISSNASLVAYKIVVIEESQAGRDRDLCQPGFLDDQDQIGRSNISDDGAWSASPRASR
jgi:hypothetical protein